MTGSMYFLSRICMKKGIRLDQLNLWEFLTEEKVAEKYPFGKTQQSKTHVALQKLAHIISCKSGDS